MKRKAIGVIRVSRVGEREGESFVSPTEQRDRITGACERDGLQLVDVLEESNVSGGAPLERRDGLRAAVERVEEKQADVIVVAYFDRLVRSLQVQAEVVSRVEDAGGAILAVDIGEVRADTASRWLSSTMLGMVSEYHRRVTAERTHGAKVRAVARGVAPFDRIPPGYRRGEGRAIEPDPEHAPTVAEAFAMRASGSSIEQVRSFLRERGVERSYHGVQSMLSSRFYLGELRFGELFNPTSHELIVDAATWDRVQKSRVSRGRRAKSERLLARLGVLRCATCGARMVVGTANHSQYYIYRCPPVGDCAQRTTISAEIVEDRVWDETKKIVRGRKGSGSMVDEARSAEDLVARSEADLDAAVKAFDGLNVASTREKLLELQARVDEARVLAEQLRGATDTLGSIDVRHLDGMTVPERRRVVAGAIESVLVAPGKGIERITIKARRKQTASVGV